MREFKMTAGYLPADGEIRDPIISVEHGYLWVGNNAKGNMGCFATLEKAAARKLARAILSHPIHRRALKAERARALARMERAGGKGR